MKKRWMVSMLTVSLVVVILGVLVIQLVNDDPVEALVDEEDTGQENTFEPHEGINQAPVPMVFERVGENEGNIELTAHITDIEIDKETTYKAWTFNGEAPGPLIVVEEGDTINFTLKNMDPAVPHSMDFHAVHAAPDKKFIDVMPNEEGTFTYEASMPGVFMYHCGTPSILQHIANGMHGIIIVQPADGYPTDGEIDREFTLIQNEWYPYNDLDAMINEEPTQVVFSTKKGGG